MSKWIRYGMGTSLVAAALLTGCGDTANPAGQTGTPKVTTTTATTAVPSTTLDISGLATTTTLPGAGVELVDGKAPKERTVTITAGVFSPPLLSVDLGDVVTFVGGDNTAYSVSVGGLPGATVTGGLVETFKFTKAGEITVSTDAGTVTMKITVAGASTPTGGGAEATTTPAGTNPASVTTVASDSGSPTTEPAISTTTAG